MIYNSRDLLYYIPCASVIPGVKDVAKGIAMIKKDFKTSKMAVIPTQQKIAISDLKGKKVCKLNFKGDQRKGWLHIGKGFTAIFAPVVGNMSLLLYDIYKYEKSKQNNDSDSSTDDERESANSPSPIYNSADYTEFSSPDFLLSLQSSPTLTRIECN